MKISLNWLNELVDISSYLINPQELSDLLTQAGLEVESIEDQSRMLRSVVVGLILEKEMHPQAQKLSVCKVMTGDGVIHQIVCGASNHKKDDRVVVALPGALLPGNFEIKPTVLRGIESGGMLCSKKELGLESLPEETGIYILDENAKIGQPISEYLKLNDIIFELKVTPNRADCLSHFGLAREVSALTERKLKKSWGSEVSKLEVPNFTFKVNSEFCSRYTATLIENVSVGESPDWIKKRLKSIGLNSINNVVDIANLVMMELGQPFHAFDADRIKGQSVNVRLAQKGEPFKALDGKDYLLEGHELVIADSEKVLCLAGVLGGVNSGTETQTKNILLEAACFSPAAIRKTSRFHGIQSDSAYRFSRGVDLQMTLVALHRAANLIVEVAGGTKSSWNFDSMPESKTAKTIKIQLQTVSDRLGYKASLDILKNYLERLQFKVIEVTSDIGKESIVVEAPPFRFDIEHEMDLVEEYARLDGYDKIPETPLASLKFPKPNDAGFEKVDRLHGLLQRSGATEVLNSLFTNSTDEKKFSGSFLERDWIPLKNPLNENMNTLRQGLSFGLFENILRNYSYGNETGFIYEIGKAAFEVKSGEYREVWKLALASWGESEQVSKVIKSILGLNLYLQLFDSEKLHPSLHPYQQSQLSLDNSVIGFLGAVHPALLEEKKMRCCVALAEIDLTPLMTKKIPKSRIQQPSRFQKVQRDLALVFSESEKVGNFVDLVRSTIGPTLIGVEVVDIYKDASLGAHKRSVTLRFEFQDQSATLLDSWVSSKIDEIVRIAKTQFKAEQR